MTQTVADPIRWTTADLDRLPSDFWDSLGWMLRVVPLGSVTSYGNPCSAAFIDR
jgi:hypothetical protein